MSSKTSSLAMLPVPSDREGPVTSFQVPTPLTATLSAPSPQLSVSSFLLVSDTAGTAQADARTIPSLTQIATVHANPQVTPLSTRTVTPAASATTINAQTASLSVVKHTSVAEAKA